MLQAVVAKKSEAFASTRVGARVDATIRLQRRNALRIVQMSASTYRYTSTKRDESALKLRIKEINNTRMHSGYRRVHVLLRREGHRDNVKRVYRLYREEGLSLRLKRPRRNIAAKLRQPNLLGKKLPEPPPF